jgi:hypothetical protein
MQALPTSAKRRHRTLPRTHNSSISSHPQHPLTSPRGISIPLSTRLTEWNAVAWRMKNWRPRKNRPMPRPARHAQKPLHCNKVRTATAATMTPATIRYTRTIHATGVTPGDRATGINRSIPCTRDRHAPKTPGALSEKHPACRDNPDHGGNQGAADMFLYRHPGEGRDPVLNALDTGIRRHDKVIATSRNNTDRTVSPARQIVTLST